LATLAIFEEAATARVNRIDSDSLHPAGKGRDANAARVGERLWAESATASDASAGLVVRTVPGSAPGQAVPLLLSLSDCEDVAPDGAINRNGTQQVICLTQPSR
jgi:hypothetical protein